VNERNKRKIAAKLRELAFAFPNREIPEETVVLYTERLSSLPAEAVCLAIDRLIDTSRFFPTIAEIKAAMVEAVVEPGFAELAWGEVIREVRRVGFGRTAQGRPRFSSPLIGKAVAAVGWETICMSEHPEVIRAQFVKTLDALVRRETYRIQTGSLSGDSEAIYPELGGWEHGGHERID
jgi:hypothetical protein